MMDFWIEEGVLSSGKDGSSNYVPAAGLERAAEPLAEENGGQKNAEPAQIAESEKPQKSRAQAAALKRPCFPLKR